MFQPILTNVILSYARKYIQNIEADLKNLSLWGGDIVLNNLELRLDVLQRELGVPPAFHFARGFIKELRVHIPWTSLTTKPVEITLHRLELLLTHISNAPYPTRPTANVSSVLTREASPAPSPYAPSESKSSIVPSIERQRSDNALATEAETLPKSEAKSSGKASSGKAPSFRTVRKEKRQETDEPETSTGWMQELLTKVLANLSVKMTDFSLKYVEDDVYCSLSINQLEVLSTDPKWTVGYSFLDGPWKCLHKLGRITGLWVKLDSIHSPSFSAAVPTQSVDALSDHSTGDGTSRLSDSRTSQSHSYADGAVLRNLCLQVRAKVYLAPVAGSKVAFSSFAVEGDPSVAQTPSVGFLLPRNPCGPKLQLDIMVDENGIAGGIDAIQWKMLLRIIQGISEGVQSGTAPKLDGSSIGSGLVAVDTTSTRVASVVEETTPATGDLTPGSGDPLSATPLSASPFGTFADSSRDVHTPRSARDGRRDMMTQDEESVSPSAEGRDSKPRGWLSWAWDLMAADEALRKEEAEAERKFRAELMRLAPDERTSLCLHCPSVKLDLLHPRQVCTDSFCSHNSGSGCLFAAWHRSTHETTSVSSTHPTSIAVNLSASKLRVVRKFRASFAPHGETSTPFSTAILGALTLSMMVGNAPERKQPAEPTSESNKGEPSTLGSAVPDAREPLLLRGSSSTTICLTIRSLLLMDATHTPAAPRPLFCVGTLSWIREHLQFAIDGRVLPHTHTAPHSHRSWDNFRTISQNMDRLRCCLSTDTTVRAAPIRGHEAGFVFSMGPCIGLPQAASKDRTRVPSSFVDFTLGNVACMTNFAPDRDSLLILYLLSFFQLKTNAAHVASGADDVSTPGSLGSRVQTAVVSPLILPRDHPRHPHSPLPPPTSVTPTTSQQNKRTSRGNTSSIVSLRVDQIWLCCRMEEMLADPRARSRDSTVPGPRYNSCVVAGHGIYFEMDSWTPGRRGRTNVAPIQVAQGKGATQRIPSPKPEDVFPPMGQAYGARPAYRSLCLDLAAVSVELRHVTLEDVYKTINQSVKAPDAVSSIPLERKLSVAKPQHQSVIQIHDLLFTQINTSDVVDPVIRVSNVSPPTFPHFGLRGTDALATLRLRASVAEISICLSLDLPILLNDLVAAVVPRCCLSDSNGWLLRVAENAKRFAEIGQLRKEKRLSAVHVGDVNRAVILVISHSNCAINDVPSLPFLSLEGLKQHPILCACMPSVAAGCDERLSLPVSNALIINASIENTSLFSASDSNVRCVMADFSRQLPIHSVLKLSDAFTPRDAVTSSSTVQSKRSSSDEAHPRDKATSFWKNAFKLSLPFPKLMSSPMESPVTASAPSGDPVTKSDDTPLIKEASPAFVRIDMRLQRIAHSSTTSTAAEAIHQGPVAHRRTASYSDSIVQHPQGRVVCHVSPLAVMWDDIYVDAVTYTLASCVLLNLLPQSPPIQEPLEPAVPPVEGPTLLQSVAFRFWSTFELAIVIGPLQICLPVRSSAIPGSTTLHDLSKASVVVQIPEITVETGGLWHSIQLPSANDDAHRNGHQKFIHSVHLSLTPFKCWTEFSSEVMAQGVFDDDDLIVRRKVALARFEARFLPVHEGEQKNPYSGIGGRVSELLQPFGIALLLETDGFLNMCHLSHASDADAQLSLDSHPFSVRSSYGSPRRTTSTVEDPTGPYVSRIECKSTAKLKCDSLLVCATREHLMIIQLAALVFHQDLKLLGQARLLLFGQGQPQTAPYGPPERISAPRSSGYTAVSWTVHAQQHIPSLSVRCYPDCDQSLLIPESDLFKLSLPSGASSGLDLAFSRSGKGEPLALTSLLCNAAVPQVGLSFLKWQSRILSHPSHQLVMARGIGCHIAYGFRSFREAASGMLHTALHRSLSEPSTNLESGHTTSAVLIIAPECQSLEVVLFTPLIRRLLEMFAMDTEAHKLDTPEVIRIPRPAKPSAHAVQQLWLCAHLGSIRLFLPTLYTFCLGSEDSTHTVDGVSLQSDQVSYASTKVELSGISLHSLPTVLPACLPLLKELITSNVPQLHSDSPLISIAPDFPVSATSISAAHVRQQSLLLNRSAKCLHCKEVLQIEASVAAQKFLTEEEMSRYATDAMERSILSANSWGDFLRLQARLEAVTLAVGYWKASSDAHSDKSVLLLPSPRTEALGFALPPSNFLSLGAEMRCEYLKTDMSNAFSAALRINKTVRVHQPVTIDRSRMSTTSLLLLAATPESHAALPVRTVVSTHVDCAIPALRVTSTGMQLNMLMASLASLSWSSGSAKLDDTVSLQRKFAKWDCQHQSATEEAGLRVRCTVGEFSVTLTDATATSDGRPTATTGNDIPPEPRTEVVLTVVGSEFSLDSAARQQLCPPAQPASTCECELQKIAESSIVTSVPLCSLHFHKFDATHADHDDGLRSANSSLLRSSRTSKSVQMLRMGENAGTSASVQGKNKSNPATLALHFQMTSNNHANYRCSGDTTVATDSKRSSTQIGLHPIQLAVAFETLHFLMHFLSLSFKRKPVHETMTVGASHSAQSGIVPLRSYRPSTSSLRLSIPRSSVTLGSLESLEVLGRLDTRDSDVAHLRDTNTVAVAILNFSDMFLLIPNTVEGKAGPSCWRYNDVMEIRAANVLLSIGMIQFHRDLARKTFWQSELLSVSSAQVENRTDTTISDEISMDVHPPPIMRPPKFVVESSSAVKVDARLNDMMLESAHLTAISQILANMFLDSFYTVSPHLELYPWALTEEHARVRPVSQSHRASPLPSPRFPHPANSAQGIGTPRDSLSHTFGIRTDDLWRWLPDCKFMHHTSPQVGHISFSHDASQKDVPCACLDKAEPNGGAMSTGPVQDRWLCWRYASPRTVSQLTIRSSGAETEDTASSRPVPCRLWVYCSETQKFIEVAQPTLLIGQWQTVSYDDSIVQPFGAVGVAGELWRLTWSPHSLAQHTAISATLLMQRLTIVSHWLPRLSNCFRVGVSIPFTRISFSHISRMPWKIPRSLTPALFANAHKSVLHQRSPSSHIEEKCFDVQLQSFQFNGTWWAAGIFHEGASVLDINAEGVCIQVPSTLDCSDQPLLLPTTVALTIASTSTRSRTHVVKAPYSTQDQLIDSHHADFLTRIHQCVEMQRKAEHERASVMRQTSTFPNDSDQRRLWSFMSIHATPLSVAVQPDSVGRLYYAIDRLISAIGSAGAAYCKQSLQIPQSRQLTNEPIQSEVLLSPSHLQMSQLANPYATMELETHPLQTLTSEMPPNMSTPYLTAHYVLQNRLGMRIFYGQVGTDECRELLSGQEHDEAYAWHSVTGRVAKALSTTGDATKNALEVDEGYFLHLTLGADAIRIEGSLETQMDSRLLRLCPRLPVGPLWSAKLCIDGTPAVTPPAAGNHRTTFVRGPATHPQHHTVSCQTDEHAQTSKAALRNESTKNENEHDDELPEFADTCSGWQCLQLFRLTRSFGEFLPVGAPNVIHRSSSGQTVRSDMDTTTRLLSPPSGIGFSHVDDDEFGPAYDQAGVEVVDDYTYIEVFVDIKVQGLTTFVTFLPSRFILNVFPFTLTYRLDSSPVVGGEDGRRVQMSHTRGFSPALPPLHAMRGESHIRSITEGYGFGVAGKQLTIAGGEYAPVPIWMLQKRHTTHLRRHRLRHADSQTDPPPTDSNANGSGTPTRSLLWEKLGWLWSPFGNAQEKSAPSASQTVDTPSQPVAELTLNSPNVDTMSLSSFSPSPPMSPAFMYSYSLISSECYPATSHSGDVSSLPLSVHCPSTLYIHMTVDQNILPFLGRFDAANDESALSWEWSLVSEVNLVASIGRPVRAAAVNGIKGAETFSDDQIRLCVLSPSLKTRAIHASESASVPWVYVWCQKLAMSSKDNAPEPAINLLNANRPPASSEHRKLGHSTPFSHRNPPSIMLFWPPFELTNVTSRSAVALLRNTPSNQRSTLNVPVPTLTDFSAAAADGALFYLAPKVHQHEHHPDATGPSPSAHRIVSAFRHAHGAGLLWHSSSKSSVADTGVARVSVVTVDPRLPVELLTLVAREDGFQVNNDRDNVHGDYIFAAEFVSRSAVWPSPGQVPLFLRTNADTRGLPASGLVVPNASCSHFCLDSRVRLYNAQGGDSHEQSIRLQVKTSNEALFRRALDFYLLDGAVYTTPVRRVGSCLQYPPPPNVEEKYACPDCGAPLSGASVSGSSAVPSHVPALTLSIASPQNVHNVTDSSLCLWWGQKPNSQLPPFAPQDRLRLFPTTALRMVGQPYLPSRLNDPPTLIILPCERSIHAMIPLQSKNVTSLFCSDSDLAQLRLGIHSSGSSADAHSKASAVHSHNVAWSNRFSASSQDDVHATIAYSLEPVNQQNRSVRNLSIVHDFAVAVRDTGTSVVSSDDLDEFSHGNPPLTNGSNNNSNRPRIALRASASPFRKMLTSAAAAVSSNAPASSTPTAGRNLRRVRGSHSTVDIAIRPRMALHNHLEEELHICSGSRIISLLHVPHHNHAVSDDSKHEGVITVPAGAMMSIGCGKVPWIVWHDRYIEYEYQNADARVIPETNPTDNERAKARQEISGLRIFHTFEKSVRARPQPDGRVHYGWSERILPGKGTQVLQLDCYKDDEKSQIDSTITSHKARVSGERALQATCVQHDSVCHVVIARDEQPPITIVNHSRYRFDLRSLIMANSPRLPTDALEFHEFAVNSEIFRCYFPRAGCGVGAKDVSQTRWRGVRDVDRSSAEELVSSMSSLSGGSSLAPLAQEPSIFDQKRRSEYVILRLVPPSSPANTEETSEPNWSSWAIPVALRSSDQKTAAGTNRSADPLQAWTTAVCDSTDLGGGVQMAKRVCLVKELTTDDHKETSMEVNVLWYVKAGGMVIELWADEERESRNALNCAETKETARFSFLSVDVERLSLVLYRFPDSITLSQFPVSYASTSRASAYAHSPCSLILPPLAQHFSFSLFHHYVPLCQLTIDGLQFHRSVVPRHVPWVGIHQSLLATELVTHMQIGGRYLQLDNHLSGSEFPVVLTIGDTEAHAPDNNNSEAFAITLLSGGAVNLCVDSNDKASLVQNGDWLGVKLSLSPLRVHVEDRFGLEVAAYVLDFLHHFSMCRRHLEVHKAAEFALLASGNVLRDSGQPQSNTLETMWQLPPSSVTAITKFGQPKTYMHFLEIAPLRLEATMHASSVLFVFLGARKVPVSFSRVRLTNILRASDRLVFDLGANYLADAVVNSPWIIGSLDLLGNPTNIVKSFAKGFQDLVYVPRNAWRRGASTWTFLRATVTGTSNLFRHITEGTLGSLSAFSGSLSRNLERLAPEDMFSLQRQIARSITHNPTDHTPLSQSVMRGISTLSTSLLGAATGIVSQPLHGASTQGPWGFVKGVGSGVVGVVAKPVSGVLDFVSHTSQGLANATSVQFLEKRQFPIRTVHLDIFAQDKLRLLVRQPAASFASWHIAHFNANASPNDVSRSGLRQSNEGSRLLGYTPLLTLSHIGHDRSVNTSRAATSTDRPLEILPITLVLLSTVGLHVTWGDEVLFVMPWKDIRVSAPVSEDNFAAWKKLVTMKGAGKAVVPPSPIDKEKKEQSLQSSASSSPLPPPPRALRTLFNVGSLSFDANGISVSLSPEQSLLTALNTAPQLPDAVLRIREVHDHFLETFRRLTSMS